MKCVLRFLGFICLFVGFIAHAAREVRVKNESKYDIPGLKKHLFVTLRQEELPKTYHHTRQHAGDEPFNFTIPKLKEDEEWVHYYIDKEKAVTYKKVKVCHYEHKKGSPLYFDWLD